MNDLDRRLKEKFTAKNANLYPIIPNKNLLIEVTNSCNLNCIFCANSKMQRKRKKINPEFVKRILKEAYDLGVKEVGFYTTGEPLLDNNLSEYVKIAKNIGYDYTYITTNAVLLDKCRTKELVNAGIDSFKLSINAINSEDYKFIHGVDAFELVINNLINLYTFRAISKKNFKIYVSYIATRYTDYPEKQIKNTFGSYCDSISIINVRNQSGLMPEINNFLSCYDTSNKIQAERNIPCHYVFDTINVTCEGFLTACCADFENYLVYADLNSTTLKEAWNNETITELRRKHINRELEDTLCNNCISCDINLPKPLNYSYIENEIDESFLNDKSVEERVKKVKKLCYNNL